MVFILVPTDPWKYPQKDKVGNESFCFILRVVEYWNQTQAPENIYSKKHPETGLKGPNK